MRSWYRKHPRRTIALIAGALLVTVAAAHVATRSPVVLAPLPDPAAPPSSQWLAMLPDGEEKRRFVLDCTGCHQIDERHIRPGGAPRSELAWEEAIGRMLARAGAETSFPVISAHRDAASTARWLATHQPGTPPPARPVTVDSADVREYLMPEPGDLPHDVAVQHDGSIVITGMHSNVMYVLDPATSRMSTVEIPVLFANPRALEIDEAGHWWVVLGLRKQLARYTPATGVWRRWNVGMYAHSVALAAGGRAWVNGHFTKEPPLLAVVDTTRDAVSEVKLPPHPELSRAPGGPVPYEIRVAPDGRIWTSELHGNRLVAHDPRTGASESFTMPLPASGPRRFDIGPDGDLWIPAYAANELVRLTPGTRQFRRWALPVRDAVPYVVRLDAARDRVWIGTAAGDVILLYEPGRGAWRVFDLPSRGALVRHLAVDPRTGDLWVAYGAVPGIPARIARLRLPDAPGNPARRNAHQLPERK